MYKNILLAYDGSDLDQQALVGCQDLTNWPSAQVTLLTVVPNFYTSIGMEGVFVGADNAHDQTKQLRPDHCCSSAQRELGCPLVG
jgi:hypothetical protein